VGLTHLRALSHAHFAHHLESFITSLSTKCQTATTKTKTLPPLTIHLCNIEVVMLSLPNNRPIQQTPILPCCKFMRCETNVASIGTVIADCVTCQLIAHQHAKPEDHPHTAIISIQDKRVSATKWMQFTTVSIAARQKPDKNNLLHDATKKINMFLYVLCADEFYGLLHNSTTSRTYWELCI